MVAFIDEHRDEYGVEPICKVLPIARLTSLLHRRRRHSPELRSKGEKVDEALCDRIRSI